MDNCLLSIIVPVYDAEKYLSDCLDSLLSQGFSEDEYEIVCVNDGSNDNSLEILKEYQKKHPQIVIIDKENGGVSSARNTALKKVKGKYVAFVDSDDCICSDSFSQIVRYMCENEVSYFKFEFSSVPDDYKFVKEEKCKIPFEFLESQYISSMIICSSIIKTEIIKEHKLFFNEKMQYAEDSLFSYQVSTICYLEKLNTAKTDMPVYKYRVNPDSAMHKDENIKKPKAMESMYILAKTFRDDFEKLTKENADNFLIEISKQRMGSAVTAILVYNLYIARFSPSELFKGLKAEHLYPYAPQIYSIHNAKTLKLKFLKILEYLFRYPAFYGLFYYFVRFLKHFYREQNQ